MTDDCLNGATRHEVRVNGVRLAFLEWAGAGPAVVCLPGTGLVAPMWKDLGPALAPAYRVLAVDPRGHGASEQAESGYSVGQFALDLIAFLEVAVDGPAIVAGHSFSASVAVHATIMRPDLVARLIFVDPSFFKRREDVDHLVGTREELIARAQARPRTWESRAALLAGLARRQLYKHWRPDHLRCYAEYGSRVDPDGTVRLTFDGAIEARVYESQDAGIWPELSQIPCPSLFLRGAHSLAMRDDLVQEALTLIPDCTFVTLPRSGHFLPMENPEGVRAAVLEWLGNRLHRVEK
jgi:esterase